MNTRPCNRTSWVLQAIGSDQLEASPELFAHYQGCDVCHEAALRALRREARRVLLDRIDEALGEEDALLAGDAHPGERWPPLTLVDGARRPATGGRQPGPGLEDADRAAPPTLDEPAPGQPVAAVADPLPMPARPLAGNVPSAPRRRAPKWPLIAAAATALLAVGIGVGVDRGPAGDVRPDDLSNEARGTVSLTLATTEGRCDTPTDAYGRLPEPGTAEPCIYPLGTELTLNLRVEPEAPARHLAVLARDAAGGVAVIFSNAAPGDEPLPITHQRVSERCRDDICWLEGGHYDVLPGTLHVVAVFSDGPLPVDEMSRDWAPEKWAGPRTYIERFEVLVRPKGEPR